MSTARIRMTLAALLLCAWPLTGAAHTDLDRAEPAVDAALEAAPSQVHIWFTSRIEPRFSRIEVYSANGTQVDKGNSVSSEDKRELTVDLAENLPSGAYKVRWNVIARDGHRVRGDYDFSVK